MMCNLCVRKDTPPAINRDLVWAPTPDNYVGLVLANAGPA